MITGGSRFMFDLEEPRIDLFKSSNLSASYRGPRTLFGLKEFINEQMGRKPPQAKVVN